MKIKIAVLVGILILVLGGFVAYSMYMAGSGNYPCEHATLANPAAVYCGQITGNSYKIIDTANGQQGICTFTNGSSCDEWEFFNGKCGQEFSYCEMHGYGIQTVSDGQNPYSNEYAVCTNGTGEVVGAVSKLSGMEAGTKRCKKVD